MRCRAAHRADPALCASVLSRRLRDADLCRCPRVRVIGRFGDHGWASSRPGTWSGLKGRWGRSKVNWDLRERRGRGGPEWMSRGAEKGPSGADPPRDPEQRSEGLWGPIVATLGPTMRREPGGPDWISGVLKGSGMGWPTAASTGAILGSEVLPDALIPDVRSVVHRLRWGLRALLNVHHDSHTKRPQNGCGGSGLAPMTAERGSKARVRVAAADGCGRRLCFEKRIMIMPREIMIGRNAHSNSLKPWATGGPKGEGPRARA